MQQYQEEAMRDVVKATGHTESNRKKGFGKIEEADIGLKELHIVRNLGGVRPITQSHFSQ